MTRTLDNVVELGVRRWRRDCLALAAAFLLTPPALSVPHRTALAGSDRVTILPPLTTGDEPVIVSHHRIQTTRGALDYDAKVGRLAIRTEETGEIRGYIFFVAYSAAPTGGKPRPITFAWNGGPLVASAIIHMEGFGPRRRTKQGMVDNADTLLQTSDLVFMDAVETGFSRPAKPEFAPDFMNMQGDVAATVEFIRAYVAQFRAVEQPLFIAGESYGVFRAAAVADTLTAANVPLAGTILVSGGIPNIPEPTSFYDAWHVAGRTATAIHYKKLDAELMRDPAQTISDVRAWIQSTYMPALERLDRLSDAERTQIIDHLARYTGMRPEQIDRKTLVVTVNHFLADFPGLDASRHMTEEDTRIMVGEDGDDLGSGPMVDRYVRDELGFHTSLTYNGLEAGYTPIPGPRKQTIREQWYYNQPGITGAVLKDELQSGEVTPLARNNPTWILNALHQSPTMKLFVATARFDPLNMCEGDAAQVASLSDDLRARIETHCYEGGHIIYRDPAARPIFLHDVAAFIDQTVAGAVPTRR
jgi:surfactin synthase thioesterase subunit